MRGRAFAAGVLALYAVALISVLLVPDGAVPTSLLARTADDAQRLGLPDWLLAPERYEFFANVLIVVPASALASIVWPGRSWTDWTALGFVGSFAVESVQAVLLADRNATYSDVVANTLGALVGGVLIALLSGLWRSAHPATDTQ
jgi:hypothetical protein